MSFFPSSPNLNDEHSKGTVRFKWDGAKWKRLGKTFDTTSIANEVASELFQPKLLTVYADTSQYANLSSISDLVPNTEYQYGNLVTDTNEFGSDITVNLSTGTFTIGSAGLYLINASHSWYSGVARPYMVVNGYINSTKMRASDGGYIRAGSGQNEMNAGFSQVVRLSADDVITFRYINTGGAGNSTYDLLDSLFQIVRIS